MIRTWLNLLAQCIGWLTGSLFLAIFCLYVVQITLRYVVGDTWLWTPDFVRFLFIWGVFLGATVLYAAKGHLTMDFFVRNLAPRNKEILDLCIDLASAAFFVLLIIKGWEIAAKRMRIPFDTWDLPTGYAYAAAPVCSALMLLFALDRIVAAIQHLSEKGKMNDVAEP
ncbi:MAG: TRAP transporter small permease [Rhodospirillales bacterium]|nr:TRAP transporter small permease [Rhodospirillales bacterium]